MGNMISVPWEIVTGCERLSPGCDNCPTYWEHHRKKRDYHPRIFPDRLNEPLLNKTPTNYLVAAGSDLFHEAVRQEFIEKVFEVINLADWHHFEVGSKRIERMARLSNTVLNWPEHALAFTGVERGDYKWRIDELRKISARRMVSFGPLIGPVGILRLNGIEVAGVIPETWGPHQRDCDPEWIERIVQQCKEQGVRVTDLSWLCEENTIAST